MVCLCIGPSANLQPLRVWFWIFFWVDKLPLSPLSAPESRVAHKWHLHDWENHFSGFFQCNPSSYFSTIIILIGRLVKALETANVQEGIYYIENIPQWETYVIYDWLPMASPHLPLNVRAQSLRFGETIKKEQAHKWHLRHCLTPNLPCNPNWVNGSLGAGSYN